LRQFALFRMFHVKHRGQSPWQVDSQCGMMFHVKHSVDRNETEALAITVADVLECLIAVGLSATEDQADLLRRHALAVIETNTRFNLTRVTAPEEVLALHIGDSATALPFIQASPLGSVADLGSGAGYPGIVLAALSGRPFVLVESVKKKAEFLRAFTDEIGMPIEVVAIRAEELATVRPAAFSAVVARALSSLPALVELASPLLVVGGHLIAMKGRPTDEELTSGDTAAARCGMRRIGVDQFQLPNGESRVIVTYERRGNVRERLPRRPGMAQRQPLG